jgi:hypothetical protein
MKKLDLGELEAQFGLMVREKHDHNNYALFQFSDLEKISNYFENFKNRFEDSLFEKSESGNLLSSLTSTMKADEQLLKSLQKKRSSGKITDIAKITFQIKSLEEKILNERKKLSSVRRHQK